MGDRGVQGGTRSELLAGAPQSPPGALAAPRSGAAGAVGEEV